MQLKYRHACNYPCWHLNICLRVLSSKRSYVPLFEVGICQLLIMKMNTFEITINFTTWKIISSCYFHNVHSTRFITFIMKHHHFHNGHHILLWKDMRAHDINETLHFRDKMVTIMKILLCLIQTLWKCEWNILWNGVMKIVLWKWCYEITTIMNILACLKHCYGYEHYENMKITLWNYDSTAYFQWLASLNLVF